MPSNPAIATLQGRFPQNADAALASTFNSAISIVDRTDNERRANAANKLLTVDGQNDKTKAFATTQRAIFLRVRSDLAEAKTKLQADRDALIPRAIDRADAAGATLRAEFRSVMRNMTSPASIAWASTQQDPAVITAIWESTPELAGLDARSRDVITANWLANHRAKQMTALDDRGETVDLVQMAVDLAQGALFTAAAVRNGPEFEAWLSA